MSAIAERQAARAWSGAWDGRRLAARVLATEHRIYPQAVQWFVQGQLRLADGLVRHAQGASQLLLQ